MRRFILKSLLFAAGLMAIFKLLDAFYAARFNTGMDPDNKIFWALGHKDQAYDFGIIGSSRAFNMIDMRVMESKTGKRGINLGNGGTGYPENYLTLMKFLETNRLATLLIEVDVYGLNSAISYSYPFHPYNFLPYLREGAVYAVYRDMTPHWKLWMWRNIPFAKYIEFNEKYPLAAFLKRSPPAPSPYDSTLGSLALPASDQVPLSGFTDKRYGVDSLDYAYLVKLIDLAKARDIKVVLYTAPLYTGIRPYQSGREQAMARFPELASRSGIRYYDFEADAISSRPDLFLSAAHLTEAGTRTFSESLADSLIANGGLP